MSNLKNKIVWITGAKRIGQIIAENLAKEGSHIVVSYRGSNLEAEKIVKKANSFGVKAVSVKCDVSKRAEVVSALKEVSKTFKKIDVLINMASVFTPVKLENIKEEDWDRNYDAHILGTFWTSQIISKVMPSGSHIINIADRTSLGKHYKGYIPYIVTKSAVSSMTKSLATELGEKGIFVNAIAPGPILRPDDITLKEWQAIRNKSIVKYKITDKEAVNQFSELVMYLSKVTMSSGYTYPLDQGQNL